MGGEGGGASSAPATKILWKEKDGRFQTEDGKAYVQYVVSEGGRVMDIVHTFVPSTMRGLGIASLLCTSAFAHARTHSMSVIPTCSYVSDTFLPRNPSWNSLVYNPEIKSSI